MASREGDPFGGMVDELEVQPKVQFHLGRSRGPSHASLAHVRVFSMAEAQSVADCKSSELRMRILNEVVIAEAEWLRRFAISKPGEESTSKLPVNSIREHHSRIRFLCSPIALRG